jgi:hypothetical protein
MFSRWLGQIGYYSQFCWCSCDLGYACLPAIDSVFCVFSSRVLRWVVLGALRSWAPLELVTVVGGNENLGRSFAQHWHKECELVPYVPTMERACWGYPVVSGPGRDCCVAGVEFLVRSEIAGDGVLVAEALGRRGVSASSLVRWLLRNRFAFSLEGLPVGGRSASLACRFLGT